MKKSEAEPIVRSLSHDWFRDQTGHQREHPSFPAFKAWALEKGHSDCFKFRSVMGADYDAELWFDQELKLMSRR